MNLETVLYGILAILGLIGTWKIFEKMGEPGWKGIIPFYNIYVLCDKVWEAKYGIMYIVAAIVMGVADYFFTQNPENIVWTIILLISAIGVLVFDVKLMIKLGKSFGKGTGFIVGLVLLAPIFELILGFDESTFAPYKKEIQV